MTKIVFTSCIRAEAFPNQLHWSEVAQLNPDYLFILGDNIYMDYWSFKKKIPPKELSDLEFKNLMLKKYKAQWEEKNFSSLVQHLRKNKGGVYGTWDDHDFAWDNATGDEVPESKKKISREMFNNFFYQEPSQAELFKFVDTAHARVIILDQRSYSEKISNDAPLIGEKQMVFLKESLNHSKTFTIICGSLPLTIGMSFFGIKLNRYTDFWSKYKREYQQFQELIQSKKNAIYVGGDIHKNAFEKPKKGLRPCHEVISSGMAIDLCASQNVIKLKNPDWAYDARKNWTLFDIDSKKVTITQSKKAFIFKRKNKTFFIHKENIISS